MDKRLIEIIRFDSIQKGPLIENVALKAQMESIKSSLLSNSLKVSRDTVPIVQKYMTESACTLTLDPTNIECYIYSKPDYNAFSISQNESGILVALSSSLIKILNGAELKFLIGHELGHAIFSHSEATHLGHGDMDYKFIKSLREMEISADRIGFMCANSLQDSITAMMKIASGLDGEFLNQDIRPFIDQNIPLTHHMNKHQYQYTTHPPLPLRAKSLVWLSTISSFNNGIWDGSLNEEDNKSISIINDQIRSDISTHLDKAMEIDFQKETDFFKLLLFTSHLAEGGNLTKIDQGLIVKECGDDSKKLFVLMSGLSKTQVKNMLTNRLRDSYRKMFLYSPNDARVLVKTYGKKFDVSDKLIKEFM